jgi:hypothetical protein
MLITTVSLDGAQFSVSAAEAADLKAACLAAPIAQSDYVTFRTAEGAEISALLRPGAHVFFATHDSTAGVVHEVAQLPGADDHAFSSAFDLDWFDYVA